MSEVEIAFKITQSEDESKKLLEKAGYEFFYSTQTHDLYFTNQPLNENMTEQDIKFSCIRFRHSSRYSSFFNYNFFDNTKEKTFKCSLDKASEYIVRLKQNGYRKVFDTYKTDLIYRKQNIFHQLQNIDGIGLLDYIYNEDIANKSHPEQFDMLTKEMKNIGFTMEYEEGIDKLRTLLSGKLCFSKNQNGNYNLQK